MFHIMFLSLLSAKLNKTQKWANKTKVSYPTCNIRTTVFTIFHWDFLPSTMTVKPRALHFSLQKYNRKTWHLFACITQMIGQYMLSVQLDTMNQLQWLHCGCVIKHTNLFVLWWHFKMSCKCLCELQWLTDSKKHVFNNTVILVCKKKKHFRPE